MERACLRREAQRQWLVALCFFTPSLSSFLLFGYRPDPLSSFDSQESVDIVEAVAKRHPEGHLHASRAVQDLITAAARRWKSDEGDYRDDITGVVIKLPCLPTRRASVSRAGHLTTSDDDDKIRDRIRRRIEKAKQARGAERDGMEGGASPSGESFRARKNRGRRRD